MRHGVIVVNDPNGLSKAGSKMYLQLFPEEVRPHTLITRDRDEIKAFANDQGRIVPIGQFQVASHQHNAASGNQIW